MSGGISTPEEREPSKPAGRLEGRNALVIGSATGIGREVCRLFAREGASLCLADLGKEEELDSLVREFRATETAASAIQIDVSREDRIAVGVDEALSLLGSIDILVNNAGVGGEMQPFHAAPTEVWNRILEVNLLGVAYGMRQVLPHMIERGYGRIVNTASQLAHKPSAMAAMYCASKAGVVALTTSVAHEVAARGITVNAVCPGPTDTPMWRAANPKWNRKKIEQLPIGRVATPREIAWTYVFLASDEASYMVGQSVSPNGGDVSW